MTLRIHTTWTVTCDGTLATACDASHPDNPHTCPERLQVPEDHNDALEALASARWVTTTQQPVVPGPLRVRHYCPAHRYQAERHDCGHTTRTPGCGGCDPGAIETVILDDGTVRPYDPARDTQPPDPYWDDQGKQHQRQDG